MEAAAAAGDACDVADSCSAVVLQMSASEAPRQRRKRRRRRHSRAESAPAEQPVPSTQSDLSASHAGQKRRAVELSSAGCDLSRILVSVGRAGVYSSFRCADMGSFDRVALLTALRGTDMFAPHLPPAVLAECSVNVGRFHSRRPTPREEAAASQLEGLDTIADVVAAAALDDDASGSAPHVFVRITPHDATTSSSSTSNTTRPTLPEAVVFSRRRIAGVRMMKVMLPDEAGVRMPFYLPPQVVAQLLHFVTEAPAHDPVLMLLVGPVKSGKTAVLHRVLPGMIAHAHGGSATAARQLMFRFTFDAAAGPIPAARKLLHAATECAAAVGVRVALPTRDELQLDGLDGYMSAIAQGVRGDDKRGCMWILLDECQYPVLAAKTFEEAMHFVAKLKDVVRTCSPFARIVMTGSSMVSFLNHVRLLPLNAFSMYDATRFVQLGVTPEADAARVMADCILQAQRTCKSWPEEAVAHVTTDALLAALHSDVILSRRPAMVAFVAGLMGDARHSEPQEVLNLAMRAAHHKVYSETIVDFLPALKALSTQSRPHILKSLYALAVGDTALFASLCGARSGRDFLMRLCEPPADSAALAIGELMRPYGYFTKLCVSEHGSLLVQWEVGNIQLSEPLRNLLVFFTEAHKRGALHAPHMDAVSDAVMSTLAANQVGLHVAGRVRAATPADLVHVRSLHLLLSSSYNSSDRLYFDSHRHDHRYKASLGLYVLRWVRNIASHDPSPAEALDAIGLSPALIDTTVQAAVRSLLATRPDSSGSRWILGAHGIPCFR